MRIGKSTATTEDNHLRNCKNSKMIDLYLKLRSIAFENLEDVTTAATADYISWSINKGRQFANFYIWLLAIHDLFYMSTMLFYCYWTIPL